MSGRREYVTVAARELRDGDRIRLANTAVVAANSTPWMVLGTPVLLAQTRDVAVHVGIKRTDRGVTIRMGAEEPVTVIRGSY